MIYKPTQNKKSAYTLAFILLICGIICILCASLLLRSVMQFFGIAFFTGCILVMKRYALQEYIYTVEPEGKGYDLLVNEICGKRSRLVCKLSLDTCVAFEKRSADPGKKYGRAAHKYNYCVNLDASEVYCFYFKESEDGELGMLFLECDSRFAGYLEERISGLCPEPHLGGF